MFLFDAELTNRLPAQRLSRVPVEMGVPEQHMTPSLVAIFWARLGGATFALASGWVRLSGASPARVEGMDSKQLVAIWYSGTALVIARLVFAVSGVSIAIAVGVVLVLLAVPVVRARHRTQVEGQVVSVGAPMLIGPLVLGAVLVGQWRAQSVVSIASETATAGDTLRTLSESTSSDETITGKVLALTDSAIGAVASRERTRPVTSAPPPSLAVQPSSPDKLVAGRSDEACQSVEPRNGHNLGRGNDQQRNVHPRTPQQDDGCVAEPRKQDSVERSGGRGRN
jgi:hypothetical protein